MNLEVDSYCFACGLENPIGLKLQFTIEGDSVFATFTPTKEHQGFVNVLHGGIISTLLDEAMAHAIIAQGHRAVTAKLELSFRKPTAIGQPVLINGRIISKKSKLIKATAQINQNGQITAEAYADFLVV